jgi:ClpP class serine protease
MLAIASSALQRGVEGFFWAISDDPILVNRRHAQYHDVAIVTIRGSLEHHITCAADSYEGIRERVRLAFEGMDVEEGETPSPPTAVILDIDSRGGVVAGLNECVADLQAMRKKYGIPLIAVLNEMAASAAFAIACAADKRYAPASAIAGSIGTISTMVSQAVKDAADGIDVRLLTSGARKADGHPHAPISDAAVKAEQARVDQLANSFFRLAGKALRVAPAKLQSLQAGIYLGPEAKRHGLIDDVRSLDQVAAGLSRPAPKSAEAKGNETKRLATDDAAGQRDASIVLDAPRSSASRSPPMKLIARMMVLAGLIAGETDPTKRASLIRLNSRKAATLAFKAEKGDDDPDDPDDEDDDDEDESKSKKAAEHAAKMKKQAEAAKHRAKAAEWKKKAQEAEEAAEAAEADDDEESEASTRVARPSADSSAATEILASQAGMASEALARVAALEARATEQNRQATISKLVAERRVTPGEAKRWASKPPEFWKQVEEMRPHALVSIDESALLQPDTSPAADLPANVRAIVEEAVKIKGLTGETADAFREKSYAAHRKALTNGAGVH